MNDKILAYLEAHRGPFPVREIAVALDGSFEVVHKALRELVNDGLVREAMRSGRQFKKIKKHPYYVRGPGETLEIHYQHSTYPYAGEE